MHAAAAVGLRAAVVGNADVAACAEVVDAVGRITNQTAPPAAKAARAVHPGSTLKGSRTSGEGLLELNTRDGGPIAEDLEGCAREGKSTEGAPEAMKALRRRENEL